jgi:uncharacterized protein (DUF362 family)
MGKVSLVKTHRGVKRALIEALDLIGGLGRFISSGDRVMLKPNLNDDASFTSRELVEALIELLRDSGVHEISIGESTFGDARMTAALFRKTGFADLAAKCAVPLHNLNESEVVEITVARPLVARTLRIAREYFEVDRVINLPNMKVHYATGITLALKNLKGLLVGDEKRRFHEIGLDKAIVDLNNSVKAHLQIVDCISCMERMGPRGGDPVRLDLLMAGESAVEVDWIGCQVMCHSQDDVGHLKLFVETNGVDLGAIETVGESIAAVRYPFKKAALQSAPPVQFRIHERNACSACMNALLLSSRLIEGELNEIIDVMLGPLPDGAPRQGTLGLAFGNCVPEEAGCDLRVKGCPPYPLALKKALSGHMGRH